MNFEFLRTQPIDISRYLPRFLRKDETFCDLLDTFSWEHEKQRLFLQELGKQFFVPTATWGIRDWERIVDVTPDAGDTYEQRRNRVLLKLNGRQVSTLDFMGQLASRYIDGDGGHIEEHNEKNTFSIVLEGNIKDKKGLDEALETYKPAHLGYDYLFHVTDLSDDPITGGDGLLTKGEAFDFGVYSQFRDNIPYGIAPHLHYDGSWQYRDGYTYADFIYGDVRAYGDIVKPGTIQYEPYTGWQFIFDGLAQYDGTWQYNGTYRYNGERPWKILYNDFMDTLSLLIITMQRPDGSTELKDDVAAPIAYGERVPYGCRQIGVNPLPIDCDGILTVTRAHPYGDTWQYGDKGRVKYNGNAQYGDGWQYDRTGVHYGVDTYRTYISGRLAIGEPKLIDPPLSNNYPELKDDAKGVEDGAERAAVDIGRFEEDADRHAIPYGEHVPYGGRQIGVNRLPVDCDGIIEVTRRARYGDAWQYGDAGRPKYNGNVQYGHGWQYSKGGVTYGEETVTTYLSGGTDVAQPKLITPTVFDRHPYLEDKEETKDTATKAVLDLGKLVRENADTHVLSYGEMQYGGAQGLGIACELPVDRGGGLTILKGHTYGMGRRYDYGVKTAYDGSMTYATMQFEGGETYGPRRYAAAL